MSVITGNTSTISTITLSNTGMCKNYEIGLFPVYSTTLKKKVRNGSMIAGGATLSRNLKLRMTTSSSADCNPHSSPQKIFTHLGDKNGFVSNKNSPSFYSKIAYLSVGKQVLK